VKLDRVVPVELRYETIVVEDGKLHIYRDVYDLDTNTEANLRTVLDVNGVKLEDLSEAERAQALDALNVMSRHPLKESAMSETSVSSSPSASPLAATTTTTPDKTVKGATAGVKKPAAKNQKEIIIELAALKGKGYPAAMNLDTGTGKPAADATAKSVR